MLGHNIAGGPTDILGAMRWLVWGVAERFGVSLPLADEWQFHKIDWAEVYDTGLVGCQLYINSLGSASYMGSRRKPALYPNETLYVAGRSSTLKFYCKGVEFAKHDAKRLRSTVDNDDLYELQLLANRLLRVEVSIKLPKLVYEFGSKPFVTDVSDEFCGKIYDIEVSRLVEQGGTPLEIVREYDAVRSRLEGHYNDRPRLVRSLLGTWFQLSVEGELRTYRMMNKATYYRQLTLLREAGVSWIGSDIIKREYEGNLPASFKPIRTDTRRLEVIAPSVLEACRLGNQYAASL
jgi:hypothetical protein